MQGFFKSFFAALLAVIVFAAFCVLVLVIVVGGILTPSRPSVGGNAVLVVDLGQEYKEQSPGNPLATLGLDDEYDIPGVYDMVRLIRHAGEDSAIHGIFLKCNSDPNGFATNEEIRTALAEFRKTGKFIFAFGDVIPQKAYYVASVADKIYCNPKGGVEWRGFASQMLFLKDALDRLQIQPQIFYAGKFKSATEPLRETRMTDANRLQLTVLLGDLYNQFLATAANSRGLDTNDLRKCVDQDLIRTAQDAVDHRLVDGLKYDDEVKDGIRDKLHIGHHSYLNFISAGKYAKAVNYKRTGKDEISVIYAEGDVVEGKGEKDEIGSDTYRWLIRKARFDNEVKAIVIRVNSGGGSSLASENIWREVALARKEGKPVVISFGDVAASGAYYLSCDADSIFALPGTITGSIGVFSIVPNFQSFFKNKLGVTFDVVKTAPEADEMTVARPLTPAEQRLIQNDVDTIYRDFKTRVAAGRKKQVGYVDSIGQGRIWSGTRGVSLGLVDRLGGMQDAIDCAARMARTKDYRLLEYPETKGVLDRLLGGYRRSLSAASMKEELGPDGYRTYMTIKKVKAMVGSAQTRMPFDLDIE